MKIGFLNNQIDNRGTGNAMFDYAHYNEELLGNESRVYTFLNGQHDKLAVEKYMKRFGNIYDAQHVSQDDLDALYHIKSGEDDGAFNSFHPYLVHAVFSNQPHGDIYATISEWMGQRFNIPFVPHIIHTPSVAPNVNLRTHLNIPKSAIVFGRHGGRDTFDIPWVWDVIDRITKERLDIWFLLMNTDPPQNKDFSGQHVIFVDPTASWFNKQVFINTCDAMLHARQRGETFGIAVGEFAIARKPVVTYANSPERAHIQELGEYGLYYRNQEELYDILDNFIVDDIIPQLYSHYTVDNAMGKFKEVFLNGISERGRVKASR